MLVNGDRLPVQCPIVGAYEETGWGGQCPMASQWAKQGQYIPHSEYIPHSDPYVRPSMQCYGGYYVRDAPQYYGVIQRYAPPLDMPCQGQQWDYNSMCYDVDGQPCQYTNIVDLEDFMNNEKRKEKSRVAARCRRTKEMQIFAELTAALPAKKEEVEQLDKASVMRLAISYLRVRDVVSMLPDGDVEPPKLESPKGLEEIQSELSYMKALDGFVLVLSQQGDIVYCSENIAEHLGVSQMEIMGQSVFEFSHMCDHEEVREALRGGGKPRRDLLLRMKCTLTSKGRNVHLKSASYKVIQVTGHMLMPDESAEHDRQNNNTDDQKNDGDATKKTGMAALIAVGRPIPHPSNIEIPLDSKTFLSKHSLDMKFTYTDEGLMNTLGFEPDELVGRSVYDYHHGADSASLVHQFKSLFSKGQCETGQYRFLAKSGGYAWVQTQATVITDKQQKPTSVVCVNYVISGIECRDDVFAAHQVQHADLKPAVPKAAKQPAAALCQLAPEAPNGAIVAAILPEEERPIPVTELIFAPRKKEMNKGFLMFSQDEGLTMLKDEPEDLTHLAPTAGDACIPLENSPFDMFDEFILSDNYCSLLGDDLANGSPVDSLTADSLLSSPDPQETESSCEQSSLLTELTLDAFDGARSDNDIDDGNSPFIPTSDELPLLESAVMWGALPDNVSLARPQPSEPVAVPSAPALQRLLAATPTGPPPQDLITNIYSEQGLISNNVSTWDTGVKRVMKQEEEPCAKRVKRSPSPMTVSEPSAQSSSVLMNLLDLPQQMPRVSPKIAQNYQQMMSQKMPEISSNSLPVPVINIIQSAPTKQMMRSNTPIPNTMSPLTLNVGSPMYSLPPSPNTSSYTSPAMSPVQRDHLLSPYSTPQSLSPVGKFSQYSPNSRNLSPVNMLHGYDPYLSHKIQSSPAFPLQQDILLDTMSLPSPDFWADSEMIQGTSDLLTAFDDVKLV